VKVHLGLERVGLLAYLAQNRPAHQQQSNVSSNQLRLAAAGDETPSVRQVALIKRIVSNDQE
jgi:hypothetical protein